MAVSTEDPPPSPGYRRIGHVPELDGLRGTAAILLVSLHLFMLVVPDQGQFSSEMSGSFLWVDMFFVLSGFLITALLLREQQETGGVHLTAFWIRRALRLLPALYVLLVVHYFYARHVGLDMTVQRESAMYTSLYVLNFRMDNILTARVSEGLTHLWSLSVEEQFYLVWPLIVTFVLPIRRHLTVVVSTLVAAIAAVALYRGFSFHRADGTNWFELYTHTHTRADSLLVGALLAYFWVHGKLALRYVPQLAWLSAAVVVWTLFNVNLTDGFAYYGGFTLVAVAFAIMILASLETSWRLRPLFRTRVLRLAGRVSYGLYLWHMVAQISVMRVGSEWPVLIRSAAAIAATIAATAFSWHVVEKPALRLKERWGRRTVSEPVTKRAPAPATAGHEIS